MPIFPKPQPDVPAALQGFTIGAAVSEDSGTPTVSLSFSVAIVSAAGLTHQLSGDLSPYLSPAQITAFTNAALSLYAKAKTELLT